MAFCTKCGTQVNESDTKCHSCGADLPGGKSSSDGIVMDILKKSIGYVLKKPFRLWGLSIMANVLMFSALVWILMPPVINMGIAFVIMLSLMGIFLDAYRGKSISAEQLFKNFTKDKFVKAACGMFWMYLWICVWLLIPIAGPVIAVMKYYSYRFTPYILNEEPDINAFDALEKSMELTKGYRLKMFGVDFLLGLAIFIINLILLLPGMLLMDSAAGLVLLLPGMLIAAFIAIIAPLIFGVIQAAFYDEVTKK